MAETSENKTNKETKKEVDLSDPKNLFGAIFEAKQIADCIPQLSQHLKKIIENSSLGEKYKILFLYEADRPIRDYTADQIYKALPKNEKKDILLIIHSMGGVSEPAFLISKICKEYSKKFVVAIPRKAKSAATLLVLGADEIHMGAMSQLGPIDPQIGGLPALGLGNAVKYLASLCKQHPEASDMFAKYLSFKLELSVLGYFERVPESAVQYAQRLLEKKTLPQGQTPNSVAEALVYSYKDHSFVIDKDEAKKYLGEYIKTNTPEYDLSNTIHRFLEDLQIFAYVLKKKDLAILGDIESGISFLDTEE